VISWFLPVLFGALDGYEAVRQRMVRVDIEARGVHSAIVLEAMRSTARHLFVPTPLRYLAYADRPLPIGHGQTISQPYVVAFMTELLDPQPHHRVLEIGTGCGYQAAVLSRLVKAVYSIEIVPELARDSAALLKQLGYDNVLVRAGDGYQGWPDEAPFDRILLTAAPPEVPKTLVDQLQVGGKLVAPEGRVWQNLVLLEKRADGSLQRKVSLPVRFVPMVRE